ncbi:MAG: class I SAM-dependent methyltransferase [Bacteroidetes bacterium]|nr:class I SAM-dependent methyltransferase [Bacteroidota bacterium]
MNAVTCNICGNESEFIFQACVLHKYQVNYYRCPHCDFIQTEKPYWLDEAYTQAINKYDTGILSRNVEYSAIVSTLIYFLFDRTQTFLDYGGGYGIFTRLMRDIGFDFYHYDPLAQNLFAQGFEAQSLDNHFELVTALECFEHFINPMEEINHIIAFSDNIFFSTELHPRFIPDLTWWYYAFDHGQHIAFYSYKTLSYIAQRYELHLISFGNFHLFTKENISNFVSKLIVHNRHRGLYWYVHKKMKSKTFSDFEKIKNLPC